MRSSTSYGLYRWEYSEGQRRRNETISAVIDVDPAVAKLENIIKIVGRARQGRAKAAKKIVSDAVADLIEAVSLSGVGKNQLQAFSKMAIKTETMIDWTTDEDTKKKLRRKLRDVANSIVLQAASIEPIDRQIAESVSETIESPREEYTPPEPEMAEEVPIEKPVVPVPKVEAKPEVKPEVEEGGKME